MFPEISASCSNLSSQFLIIRKIVEEIISKLNCMFSLVLPLCCVSNDKEYD